MVGHARQCEPGRPRPRGSGCEIAEALRDWQVHRAAEQFNAAKASPSRLFRNTVPIQNFLQILNRAIKDGAGLGIRFRSRRFQGIENQLKFGRM